MKKFFLALGLAALCLSIGAEAYAQATNVGGLAHPVTIQLRVRKHYGGASATTPNPLGFQGTANWGYDAVGYYSDSLADTRKAGGFAGGTSTIAAGGVDTTVAISTEGFFPRMASTDSSTALILYAIKSVAHSPACTACDTLWALPQGSFDGQTWFNINALSTGPGGIDPFGVAAGPWANLWPLISTTGASTEYTAGGARWSFKNSTALGSYTSMIDLPYLRFLILRDTANSTTAGQYNYYLRYFGASQDRNR